MSPAASSRWCPTPEQLMILEELYRSGVRTPNAAQIQRITAHLSLYGKIEGKNVFYWFQNHKARDRQKLRKKLIKQLQLQQQKQVLCPCGLPQQELVIQQDQSNHHVLLNCFDPLFIPSPASSTSDFHHQLPCHNYSPGFPPQVGNEGAHTTQITDHAWKGEIPPRITEDPNMIMGSMCCHDWMMMMTMMEDVGPPLSPFCNATLSPTRPLETLELFPITATSLKEDCNPSPRRLSCLTPTN